MLPAMTVSLKVKENIVASPAVVSLLLALLGQL
jgi:hypothetical protein